MDDGYIAKPGAREEYHCLKCGITHYDNEPIYAEHIILHQSKEGIKKHEHDWKEVWHNYERVGRLCKKCNIQNYGK